jgi:uracil-DNA glycosylase
MSVRVHAQPPSRPFCGLAFLAEAPSDEECEKGVPLVGPSGRVFNSLLRTAGIDREACWVGNVFDEQLPGNSVAGWCAPGLPADWDWPAIGTHGQLKPEHRHHLLRLSAELAALRPTVVVPLGGTALWALTGSDGIMACRGAVAKATLTLPGAKIVPAMHPAAVMRAWKYYSVTAGDLIKAERECAEGPEVRYPTRRLLIEPTERDVVQAVVACANAPLISVDIETGWKQITCIGFAWSEEDAICIPFVDLRKPDKSYWPDAETEGRVMRMVRDILQSPTPKLGQNFPGYDMYWILDRWGMHVNNFLHDTRLLHHSLYPELPKSLSFMQGSYSRQGVWKTWGGRGLRTDKGED